MKAVNSIFYSLFIPFLCYTQEIYSPVEDFQNIDPFIETQQLNENCILVKFGADAITAVNTKNGIVVIDAGISSGLTARYRNIIENEFHKNNFIYVINTHSHWDHCGGNCVFEDAEILGQVNCVKEIAMQCKNPEKRIKALNKIVEEYNLKSETLVPYSKEWIENLTQKARYQSAYNDARKSVHVKTPDKTFSDSLNIISGDVTFEMLYFGKFHSCSDIMIYIPEMKILFTGDLFSKYGRLNIDDKLSKDSNKLLKSVQWIEKRMNSIDTIISGHGDILTPGDLKSFTNNIRKKYSPV